MINKHKRMALYEAVSKAGSKPGVGMVVEPVKSVKPVVQIVPVVEPIKQAEERPAVWPLRAKMVQFNTGRVDVSVPYQLVVATALGIILLLLIVYGLGRNSGRNLIADSAAKQVSVKQLSVQPVKPQVIKPAVIEAKKTELTPDGIELAVKPKSGENRIVIKQYHDKRELEPVQKYFAENGIETEILERVGIFFLVSKDTYENPEKAGTDGAAAKKKIIQVGSGYRASPGYVSFAPRFFNDAYGEKIK